MLTEQHEVQHNLEILSTTAMQARSPGMGGAGAGQGTPEDPRQRDPETDLWNQWVITGIGGQKGAKTPQQATVGVAFDPNPRRTVTQWALPALDRMGGFKGFAERPPASVTLDLIKTRGKPIHDPEVLLELAPFGRVQDGPFVRDRLLGGALLELAPRRVAGLNVQFDLRDSDPGRPHVIHLGQFDRKGTPTGGLTIIAMAPRD